MWQPLVSACRSALPFLIGNMIPLANFVGLMFVLYVLQQRTSRFKHIEKDLDALKKKIPDA